ncbi:hypothetical protein ANN_13873 [Periplaneta americana]|uniref:Uncharacterized protein n=1 Tax=Periplaneta americana TaxID=6978 RepID=A0ABQ8SUR4_PERAM|nr:hypothetical protein ANN_13873 [Periplaneta americana]
MEEYTRAEYADLIFEYGWANVNRRQAHRFYGVKYPNLRTRSQLQEYCVCPQNMPQFDSEGIPNQAPETNKPMILNGPTSRNREGSDQETFDLSTGEPYD